MSKIEDAIERLLDYLSFADKWEDCGSVDYGRRSGFGNQKLSLKYFDEAEAFPVDVDVLGGLTKTYERVFVSPNEIRPSDLKTWDVRLLSYPKGDFTPILKEQPLYFVTRRRRVDLKDVRGLFKLKSSYVVEHSQAALLRNGKYQTQRTYVQYVGNGRWEWCDAGERMDDYENTCENMSLSIALSSFYDWKVVLGFHPNLPTISLVTDPVGSREIFRLRDIPNGASRRTALRHWVREHYRKTGREEPYDERKILAHLRGAEEFTWNGMYCKIVPSAHDIQKAERIKAHA